MKSKTEEILNKEIRGLKLEINNLILEVKYKKRMIYDLESSNRNLTDKLYSANNEIQNLTSKIEKLS